MTRDYLYEMKTNFRMVMGSFSVSRTGISAFSLMVIWITLKITGSPIISGLADGLFSVPLLFSFIVGAFIDRSRHKKTIAITAVISRSAAVLLLMAAAVLHIYGLAVFFIYLSVVAVGFTSDVTNAVRAVWFKIFLKEEDYQRGSSVMNGIGSIAEVFGYLLSGVFLFIGIMAGVTALAVVFLIAAIPLFLIRHQEADPHSSSVADGLRGGLRFLAGDRFLQEGLFLTLVANMAVAMIGIAFTVMIQDVFQLPAIYLSFIFIAISAGIAAGSIPGARLKGRLDHIAMPLLLMVGIAFVSVTFIRSAYLLYIPVFVMGAMIGMINPPMFAVLNRHIPSDMMARIMGLFNTFALSMTFLSGAIGGVIIELSSDRSLFTIIGIVISACAVSILFLRAFRAETVR